MKKLLTILLAASVLTSPALARDDQGRGGGHHERRYERHEGRHDRHDRRGHSDFGRDLTIGLGGFLLGSALAQQNQRRREESIIIIERNHRAPVIIERRTTPRFVTNGELYFYRGDWCQTITTQDSFGYILEQHIECH